MYGITYGDTAYAGELPYWRAIVEATADASAPGDVDGLGNPIAQGLGAIDSDGVVTVGPVAIVTSGMDATGDAALALNGVVLIESSPAFDAAADVAPTTAVLIESSGTFTADGDLVPIVAAIGVSSASMSADGDFAPVALAIATGGASIITADVEVEAFMSAGEAVPLYNPVPPELQPLIQSHEADDLELELKELFILMFETHVRPDERYVNVLGMPQNGPRELIEQSLANDGLSIYRGADTASGAGAYLLRAWRAMNPKRGKHLLETYLQLLWPNVWTADQMWQDKEPLTPYPTALVEADGGDHFLTSRVNVTLPARITSGGDLNAIQAGLRASMPARMVMNLAIVSEDSFGIGMATAYYPGLVAQSYEGTIA